VGYWATGFETNACCMNWALIMFNVELKCSVIQWSKLNGYRRIPFATKSNAKAISCTVSTRSSSPRGKAAGASRQPLDLHVVSILIVQEALPQSKRPEIYRQIFYTGGENSLHEITVFSLGYHGKCFVIFLRNAGIVLKLNQLASFRVSLLTRPCISFETP
jgi:hypothetical protein